MGSQDGNTRTPTVELPGQTRRLGKYELITEIGMGGMASVYLARLVGPMNFQKVVVVKTIHPHLAREDEFIHMLLDEARISALIKHPNVVDIYDLGVAGGTYFIAMEYLAGQPLSMLLKKGRKGARLDPYTAADIIAKAAAGLHAAHDLTTMAGEHLELIHRDVSPGNIMVLYDGSVKLVDFGVTRARGRITASDTGQLKGKVGYVAPEQVDNAALDRRVDVYSLGVCLWELLTYSRLFRSDSQAATLRQISAGDVARPSTLRPDIPAAIENICLRALSRSPDDRFATADDMRRALVDATRDADYDVHALPAYMAETFAAQRAARARLLREVAGAEASGAIETELYEVELDRLDAGANGTPVPGRVWPDGASSSSLGSDASVAGGDASDELSLLPRRRFRFWPAALVAALLLGIGALALSRRDGPPPVAGPVTPAPVVGAGATGAAGARDPASGAAAAPAPAGAHDVDAVDDDGSAADAVGGEAAAEPLLGGDAGDGAVADDAPPSGAAADVDIAVDAADGEAGGRAASRDRAAADRLYKQGLKYFVSGDAGRAKQRFRRALQADSTYAPALRGLGLAYERLGRREKAVQWLRKYVRAVPGARDAKAIRARIERLGG